MIRAIATTAFCLTLCWTSAPLQAANSNLITYRGYLLELSEIEGNKNFAEITDRLRDQVDIVESVGLSPSVLKFFHSIPIVVDDLGCSSEQPKWLPVACYGPVPNALQNEFFGLSVWSDEKGRFVRSNGQDVPENVGAVTIRSPLLEPERPILLHEMLHAYHEHLMPAGVKNPNVLFHYNFAKNGQLYPDDAYLMANEKEFFAVTASIFLFGKEKTQSPFTRSNLKEKQPAYYQYLVWLFGFDPDRVPIASNN
jgi:hypothetical protein